jgi:hypothetical protein
MLIDMALCEELFHTAPGTAFADIMVDGHRETWPIRSKRFRGWLRRRYYQATGGAASAAEIRSALDLLEARAQFDGPERAVHIRIAEHAGHIYLDLADEQWRAVDIGPDGWRVIGSPPVRFRRPAGMLPLPVPQQGGSIESLNSFLILSSRDDFVLVVAWLLAALRSGGPYPLLAISGEQGSAKTVLSKLLKALIDPNAAPVRSLSREERELMIAAARIIAALIICCIAPAMNFLIGISPSPLTDLTKGRARLEKRHWNFCRKVMGVPAQRSQAARKAARAN